MKKKLFSILLSLTMVITMMPAMSMAVFAAEHTHNDITFEAWTDNDSLPTNAGSYYLDCDVTLTTTWNVPAGTTNLCLNGHIIQQTSEEISCINIEANNTLNLYDCDSTTTHAGYIELMDTSGFLDDITEPEFLNSGFDGFGVWRLGTGVGPTKEISGGIITGVTIPDDSGNMGAAVFCDENGFFNMYGGTICGNATYYGAILNYGTMTYNGGQILFNTGFEAGGICSAGNATITDGKISQNIGFQAGGIQNYNNLILNGGTIDHNCGIGGGVQSTETMEINDVNICNNVSYDLGGGGLKIKGTASMNGGKISHNISQGKLEGGGGVCIMGGTFTLNGGSIDNNVTNYQGGGVYIYKYHQNLGNSTFVMNGGTIERNYAKGYEYDDGCLGFGYGGGIYNDCILKLHGGSVCNNKAETMGGGIMNFSENGMEIKGNPIVRSNSICGDTEKDPFYQADVGLEYSYNLGTIWAIDITDLLENADIHIWYIPEDPFTTGYLQNNPGAGAADFFHSDYPGYCINFSGNELILGNPTVGSYSITTAPGVGGNVTADNQIAEEGNTVTLTVTPDTNYELDTLTVTDAEGQAVAVTNNTFTMPGKHVTVKATFKESSEPDPGTGGGTGGVTEPAAENYSIPVTGENTVNVEAKIENGTATVKEITKEELNKVIDKGNGNNDTDKIVIDLSGAKQEVTGVELTKTTVNNLADVVSSNKNVNTVEVEMSKSEVGMNGKTLETVGKEAAGNIIKLVVDDTKLQNLKQDQQKALSYYDLNKTFEAYFESNGVRIHDFKGGKATVGIDFKAEKDKSLDGYKIYYVKDNGNVEKYSSKYEDGMLKFTTTHFSDYAICYEGSNGVLLLNAKTSGSNAVKLSWNKQDNAKNYVVYGAMCGNDFKKLKTVKGNSYTVKKIGSKKLKAHKAYKFYVVAYDNDGNKIKSKTDHFIAANTMGKYANVKTIKAKTKSLTLNVGESKKVGATYKIYSGKKHLPTSHGTKIRYISANNDVAKVSSNGKVTAVSAGMTTIYIQDICGKYCEVAVVVK